jgi:hypothetical protein
VKRRVGPHVSALALVACVPDAEPRPVEDLEPETAICPLGPIVELAALNDAVLPQATRARDGAVLLAHVPKDASLEGATFEWVEQLDGDGWSPSAAPIEPCGRGGHVPLESLVLDERVDEQPGGRVIERACGIRADAPSSVVLVDPTAPPDTWLDPTSTCDGDQWLWLWTARSCAQIHERFPDAPTGVFVLDPDGPGGEEPGRAFCDQVTLGGGWTRVLGVERKNGETPLLQQSETLSEGLAFAASMSGTTRSTTLTGLPTAGVHLELRFFCERVSEEGSIARIHLVTQGPDVARYFQRPVEPPLATFTFTPLDASFTFDPDLQPGDNTVPLAYKPDFWGETLSGFIATGRWGHRNDSSFVDQRLGDRPIHVGDLPGRGDVNLVSNKGFSVTADELLCDSVVEAKARWMVFAR